MPQNYSLACRSVGNRGQPSAAEPKYLESPAQLHLGPTTLTPKPTSLRL